MCNNKVGEHDIDYENLPDNIGFDISDRAASHGLILAKYMGNSSSFMKLTLDGAVPVTRSGLSGKHVSWHAALLNKEDALYIYNTLLKTSYPYLRSID
jgi:hypothetical protein